MSSRLFSPDDPQPTGPVVWRHVDSLLEEPAANDTEVLRRAEVRIAELERECEQPR